MAGRGRGTRGFLWGAVGTTGERTSGGNNVVLTLQIQFRAPNVVALFSLSSHQRFIEGANLGLEANCLCPSSSSASTSLTASEMCTSTAEVQVRAPMIRTESTLHHRHTHSLSAPLQLAFSRLLGHGRSNRPGLLRVSLVVGQSLHRAYRHRRRHSLVDH